MIFRPAHSVFLFLVKIVIQRGWTTESKWSRPVYWCKLLTFIIARPINKCRSLFHGSIFLRYFAGDWTVHFRYSFHTFQCTTLSWTSHTPNNWCSRYHIILQIQHFTISAQPWHVCLQCFNTVGWMSAKKGVQSTNKYERYYWTRKVRACLLTLLRHYGKPHL